LLSSYWHLLARDCQFTHSARPDKRSWLIRAERRARYRIAEKIPPLVTGGAPVGTEFQYTYTKEGGSLECVAEYVKVSAKEWEERPTPGVAAGCLSDVFISNYPERESGDPRYILLYDEGRSLFARLTFTEKEKLSPSEWRLVSTPTWNVTHSVTRTK
jgi:hypothetical protein